MTVERVGDGVGIHGRSLSIWQIVQVVLALTGAASPSKRPFALSFLVRVPMIWSHAQEIYCTGSYWSS